MIASTALTSAAIGGALAGAHRGERVLGGMAQPLEPRQVEEAAAALDGVDEAENRVEPRAIVGLRLPGDDLAGERFQRLARLGDEFVQQIVHGPAADCRRWRG